LEESGKPVFIDVTGKFDRRISDVLLFQRLNITRRLRVISPPDHKLCIRQCVVHNRERLDHQFKPLIRSPLSECQNAMLRITAPRKVGILRPPRQHSVRTQMNISAAIFFVQNLSITRHEH
jgi:hypothetical protein